MLFERFFLNGRTFYFFRGIILVSNEIGVKQSLCRKMQAKTSGMPLL